VVWMVAMAWPTDASSAVELFGLFPYNPVAIWFSVIPQLLLLALVLPSAAAAIAREREVGTLEMLLLTRLSVHDILLGKLLAPLLPSLKVIGLGLAAVVLALALQRASPLGGILATLQLLLFVLYAGTVALFASTQFRNTGRALGMAAVLLVVMSYFHLDRLLLPLVLLGGLGAALTGAIARRQRRAGRTPSVGLIAFGLSVLALLIPGLLTWYLFHAWQSATAIAILTLLLGDPLNLLTMFRQDLLPPFLAQAWVQQIIRLVTAVLTPLVYAAAFYALAAWKLARLRQER